VLPAPELYEVVFEFKIFFGRKIIKLHNEYLAKTHHSLWHEAQII